MAQCLAGGGAEPHGGEPVPGGDADLAAETIAERAHAGGAESVLIGAGWVDSYAAMASECRRI